MRTRLFNDFKTIINVTTRTNCIVFDVLKYRTISWSHMFFNSYEKLSFSLTNILIVQITWTRKLVDLATLTHVIIESFIEKYFPTF